MQRLIHERLHRRDHLRPVQILDGVVYGAKAGREPESFIIYSRKIHDGEGVPKTLGRGERKLCIKNDSSGRECWIVDRHLNTVFVCVARADLLHVQVDVC